MLQDLGGIRDSPKPLGEETGLLDEQAADLGVRERGSGLRDASVAGFDRGGHDPELGIEELLDHLPVSNLGEETPRRPEIWPIAGVEIVGALVTGGRIPWIPEPQLPEPAHLMKERCRRAVIAAQAKEIAMMQHWQRQHPAQH